MPSLCDARERARAVLLASLAGLRVCGAGDCVGILSYGGGVKINQMIFKGQKIGGRNTRELEEAVRPCHFAVMCARCVASERGGLARLWIK